MNLAKAQSLLPSVGVRKMFHRLSNDCIYRIVLQRRVSPSLWIPADNDLVMNRMYGEKPSRTQNPSGNETTSVPVCAKCATVP